eukprot:Tbor_TRINITY_DN5925_c1_g2::TRINITY_DN5925_c1_g2_i5::g.19021::m.19021
MITLIRTHRLKMKYKKKGMVLQKEKGAEQNDKTAEAKSPNVDHSADVAAEAPKPGERLAEEEEHDSTSVETLQPHVIPVVRHEENSPELPAIVQSQEEKSDKHPKEDLRVDDKPASKAGTENPATTPNGAPHADEHVDTHTPITANGDAGATSTEHVDGEVGSPAVGGDRLKEVRDDRTTSVNDPQSTVNLQPPPVHPIVVPQKPLVEGELHKKKETVNNADAPAVVATVETIAIPEVIPQQ